VAIKREMQEAMPLSVTEEELVVAAHCYQEILYVKKVFENQWESKLRHLIS
jgi:hypothetical protein